MAPTAAEHTAMVNPFTVREHWAQWTTGRIAVALIECGAFADEYRVYWNGVLLHKGRSFPLAAAAYETEAAKAAMHDIRGA